MIDVESQVYTKVATALRAVYADILVMSRTIFEPAEYPCVCIEQTDSFAVLQTRDSASNENHMEIAYTVNVYSMKENTAKSEAKAIMAIVDDTMTAMGFTLAGCVPVSMGEAQKYRLTARYRAIVGRDETIYRS
jgi:hypothetical protein